MYADQVTDSMRAAIEETERRREKQLAYNREHGIDPQPLRKKIADVTDMLAREEIDTESLLGTGYREAGSGPDARTRRETGQDVRARLANQNQTDLAALMVELTDQMQEAAKQLQFEVAARLRDEVQDLKKELRQMREAN